MSPEPEPRPLSSSRARAPGSADRHGATRRPLELPSKGKGLLCRDEAHASDGLAPAAKVLDRAGSAAALDRARGIAVDREQADFADRALECSHGWWGVEDTDPAPRR
jgi:hypothetical protein